MGLVKSKVIDEVVDRYIYDLKNINPTKKELDRALEYVTPEFIDRVMKDVIYPTNPVTGFVKLNI